MKKQLKQYLTEQYAGSVSAMAQDWGSAESSIRQNINSKKPVNVYRDDRERIENALLLLDQLDLSKAKCLNMVKAELNHYLNGTGNGGRLTIESELRAKK